VRIHALVVDYDGTLARRGKVDGATVAALERLRASGRVLVLVTGRQLADLQAVAPDLKLFDGVVAENGAVLFDPRTQELTLLGEPPPPELPAALRRRGVPFDVGRVIVATSVPHDVDVLAVIRQLGLERQVIYNKGAVMVLPSGVTKAAGLAAALDRLGISPHNAAGIGDAENDHSFLGMVEVAAAVRNALPAIKARVDVVTRHANGHGVAELIDRGVLTDFAGLPRVFRRYSVELGTTRTGRSLRVPVYGATLLVLGASGSGKSTLTGALVERLVERGYQVCVVDPEGDHAGLEPLVMVGSSAAAPSLEEIEPALTRATAGLVVNLVALKLEDKVRFSAELLAMVMRLRAARGRPHWLILDEAHHLLPAQGSPGVAALPADPEGFCLVTLGADLLTPAALAPVTHLYVVGADAPGQARRFAAARGLALPRGGEGLWELREGEALATRVVDGRLERPRRFRVAPRRTQHRRHVRKYAGGDLGDHAFHFRGPEGRLNLRAGNVMMFVAMARGVDAETWCFHLQRGDIAAWLRDKVKDPELADQIDAVARRATTGEDGGRAEALALIEGRYTAGG
jgi:hydroxymethylpyrimidine pyrophosphatase-like HAD family hydrolase